MRYSQPLRRVTLVRRYKRFLADVVWPDGREMTVHTANTGAMLGCAEPGSPIWIRDSHNDKRKYRYSWEISETAGGVLVGVNTVLANQLVREGVEQGVVAALAGYPVIRTEVPYGQASRVDLLLQDPHDGARPDCYVEVKNVTARAGAAAIFPDAVTARGRKHLLELAAMVRAGHRAVIFFCVQREDCSCFRAAAEIDPGYARTLAQVAAEGVEVLAYAVEISPEAIVLRRRLPVEIAPAVAIESNGTGR